jgi:hypothetical protein
MLLQKNQEATEAIESKGLKRNKKKNTREFIKSIEPRFVIKRRNGHLHAKGGKHNLSCSVTLAR